MKLLHGLFSLTAGLGLCQLGSSQTTLFSQNFSTLGATAPITNSTGTTSTQVSNVNGTLGSGVGSFNYRLGSQQSLSINDKGGGDFALRMTDNNTVANDSTIHANFTGVSTNGTGNNIIFGSFDYTPLTLNSGTRGNLVFGLGTFGSNSTSGASTAVQIILNGGSTLNAGMAVSYVNGGTTVTVPSITLAAGTTYRFAITADFGSETQDTWAMTITDLSTSAELSSVTGVSTRAANIIPGAVFFQAASNAGRISADPMFQLDNINFVASSAIPEPGSFAAVLGGAALLLVGSRRRRA